MLLKVVLVPDKGVVTLMFLFNAVLAIIQLVCAHWFFAIGKPVTAYWCIIWTFYSVLVMVYLYFKEK